MRQVLAVVALVLAVAAPAASAERGRPAVRVAQAAPSRSVDGALADVARGAQRRAQLAGTTRELQARYQQQLASVDDLKRQRASWRRDRQLQHALADSLETAKQLAATADQIAATEAQLARARQAAVAAIDVELSGAPDDARRAALVAARKTQAGALAPAHPKRIVLPDDTLDPLADPEELDQQAAALVDGEAELSRQVDSLARQADRFAHQAELLRQHQRADDLAMRDDAEPRRTSGGTVGAGNASDRNPTPQGGGSGAGDSLHGDPTTPSSSFEGQPDFVLADVIDASAIDGLRRAEHSSDPGAKAQAAAAARDQVTARLRRLRERRAAIEARARELRQR